MLFQNFRETRKRWTFVNHTKPLHTLMADSVQWLSQSDYSICISILVEFYKYWRDAKQLRIDLFYRIKKQKLVSDLIYTSVLQ